MDNDLEDIIDYYNNVVNDLTQSTTYTSTGVINNTMDAVQYAAEDFRVTRDMLEQYPFYYINTANTTTSTASAVAINDRAYYSTDYERIEMENEILKRKLAESLGIDLDEKPKNNNDWEVEI